MLLRAWIKLLPVGSFSEQWHSCGCWRTGLCHASRRAGSTAQTVSLMVIKLLSGRISTKTWSQQADQVQNASFQHVLAGVHLFSSQMSHSEFSGKLASLVQPVDVLLPTNDHEIHKKTTIVLELYNPVKSDATPTTQETAVAEYNR